jgi:hypothetical protein
MAGSSSVSFGYWAVAGAIAVATGAGIAVWHGPSTVEVPAPPPRDMGSRQAPMPAPPTLAAAPAVSPAAAPARASREAPPPAVSAQDWQRLHDELAERPAELRRVAGYFVYVDQVQRFWALGGTAGPERAALARVLDAGLDARLRQREVNAAEARLI